MSCLFVDRVNPFLLGRHLFTILQPVHPGFTG